MFKHRCHDTAKINARAHVMTSGLIYVARIGMHYTIKRYDDYPHVCCANQLDSML